MKNFTKYKSQIKTASTTFVFVLGLFIINVTEVKAVDLPTLRPTATGTINNVVNENTNTTNLHQSVDDDPDSPTTSDYVQNVDNESAASVYFDITDMPSGFESMDTLQVDLHINAPVGFSDDTSTLHAQVFQSNESTSLTEEVQLATNASSAGLKTAIFNTVTAGDATTWNGARLRLRWTYSQNMGPDNGQIRVTALELDGTYTPQTITVSGTIRQTDESTAYNCSTDNLTIHISVNGGSNNTTTCNSSGGTYTIEITGPTAAGQPIAVFIDSAETPSGTTVTLATDTSSNISNLDIFQDRIVVTHESAGPITNSNLSTADNADPGIVYNVSSSNLTVDSGVELHVKSSKTYDPGGTVTTQGSGNLHIDDSATSYLDTATNTIAGDITIDSGAALNIDADTAVNGGDITATGTLTTTTGTPTVTMGATGTIGGGGTITFHDLTVSDTFTTNIGSSISVNGGDMTTTGTSAYSYSGTPTTTINGTGNLGGGGTTALYNLIIGDGNNSQTTTVTSALTLDNSLTVNATETFAIGTNNVTVGSTSVSGSGDITINGNTSQSSAGVFTILSNTSDATFSGSGTLTVYDLDIGDGTNTVSVDNNTNDLLIRVNNDFEVKANATFKASDTAGFTVSNAFLATGTFTHNDGTVTMDAPDATGNTIATGSSNFGTLIIEGVGTFSFSDSNETITGDFTIDVDTTTVTAPSGTLTVNGNFTGGSAFSANSGTVSLAGANGATQEVSGDTTFSTLSVTASANRTLQVAASSTQTVSGLTLTGTSCSAMLVLRSSNGGTAFTIANNDSTPTVSYTDFQDTTVTTNTISSGTGIVDSGGNTGITEDGTCPGASSSGDATAQSFQRKTFYDSTNEVHWMGFYDGNEIEVKASVDSGSTWTRENSQSYNTNDFSLWNETISATESAYLAVKSGDDVVVRRGNLSKSDSDPSVTWESAVTAFDGTGANDTYSYPFVSLDSSNYIWVGARFHDGTNYVYKAVRSDIPAESDWSSMTFGTNHEATQIMDNQTDTNVHGNIVPLASQDMYATIVNGTILEGCLWDNSESNWENSAGNNCAPTQGGTSIDITTDLQGYWKMNESSWNGTTDEVADSSDNDNNGTANGGVTTAAAPFNRAGDFQGSSHAVNIGDPADGSLDFGANQDFSIATWVKFDTIDGGVKTLLRKSDSGNGWDGYYLRLNGSTAQFQITSSVTDYVANGSTTISTGDWVHIVGVRTGSTLKVYVDGKQDGVQESGTSGSVATTASLFLGKFNDSTTETLDGLMDEVRIYNRALTAEEINYLYKDVPDSVKIDDASDFGSISGGRRIIRLKNGDLYTALDTGSVVEMWKSTDGHNWTIIDSGNSPSLIDAFAVATDNNDNIYSLIGWDNFEVHTFQNDTWLGTSTTVTNCGNNNRTGDIAVDSNNVWHVVVECWNGTNDNDIYYMNSSSLNLINVDINNSNSSLALSIEIDKDNIPTIVYIDRTFDWLVAKKGNQNLATSFSTFTVDSSINSVSGNYTATSAFDTITGKYWIAYSDSDDTISLASFNGGTFTDSNNWTINTDKNASTGTNDVGYRPSLAIAGNNQIYVFYQDNSTDSQIVYDVYDSINEEWNGETTLHTPPSGTDYQQAKAKWAFEWNNYGANRIDYLYSDGTDVYWDFLHVRREPTNIDSFDAFSGSGRKLVRDSTGNLYAAVNDNTNGTCEIWKSSDEGNSWSEQDSANHVACDTNSVNIAVAIDSQDVIHLVYDDGVTSVARYTTFDTTTDSWGGTIEDASDFGMTEVSIAIDSNDKPHITYFQGISSNVYYTNRISGSWKSDVSVYNGTSVSASDLAINENNIPEITFVDNSNDDLYGAEGNQNDASSFTTHAIDTTVLDSSGGNGGPTIAIDSSGNTWIAYIDEDGTDDFVTLAKHDNGTTWDSAENWTTDITNSKVGFEPSIAIDGTEVYVFYEDDQDDIVFDKYDGSSWSGETLLDQHGSLQDVKAKWSYLNNYGSDGTNYGSGGSGIGEIDYLYSDGTDVFYNRYTVSLTPGSQDAIDTVVASSTHSTVIDSTNNDVHVIFYDDEATDQLSYKRWDSGTLSWDGSAISLSPNISGISSPTLSVDSNDDSLVAFFVNTSNDDLYYSKCQPSNDTTNCSNVVYWNGDTAGERENQWQTGTITNPSSNFTANCEAFAVFSEGSTQVTIEWNFISGAGGGDPVLIQNDYEWFVNEGSTTLSDAWPSGSVDIGENTAWTQIPATYLPSQSGDKVRIQMNFTIGGGSCAASLSENSQKFQLQYAEANSCTLATDWKPVGNTNDDVIWRLFDDASIASSSADINQISTSDNSASGLYSEGIPTELNPNSVTGGQDSEWDWPIENNGASENTSYCFRMVKDDGSLNATVFDTYNADSFPRLVTNPGMTPLMRHGNFFENDTERGFFWAN